MFGCRQQYVQVPCKGRVGSRGRPPQVVFGFALVNRWSQRGQHQQMWIIPCWDSLGRTLWCKRPVVAHSRDKKNQQTKRSMPHFHASPVREAGETIIRHNLYFFGMKRINRKRVAKLTVYYTCVNVFSIYLLLFVYRCVIFFKTSPVFGEGLI